MNEVKIRKATDLDAAEIANVHINSWREAYVGLLPKSFLDERPLYFKNRYELWKRVTADPAQITFVAECPQHGVVGFINGKEARDKEFEGYGEVFCLYLFKKYHDKKIGHGLLKIFFDELMTKGFKKAYLWVLKDNPTINFYLRTGAHFTGHAKEEEIGGQKVQELCYSWENLKGEDFSSPS